ncbi:hypothetical protein M0802_005844 [Mischocyttarus mexicanus]|nr:hypothetical protein M0802_005844 [Mischocyttarus mexicanus]
MEEHVLHDVLHVVFKNLDYKDLYNASLVNSYWKQVAKEENYRRGIVCNTLLKDHDSVLYNAEWEERYFQYLLKMSSFNVFVTNLNYRGPPIIRCYCQYYNLPCCSVMLQQLCSSDILRYADTVTFPDSHKTQFNTITFRTIFDTDFVYCPELRQMSGPDFELPSGLRVIIERYFDRDGPMKSCMILISDLDSTHIIKNIFEHIKRWFPNGEISVWCGMIIEIKVCKNLACKNAAEIILIFISSRSLKTWVTSWPVENETREIIVAKLEEFKARIELKKHSIALIYKSRGFISYGHILQIEFERIFGVMPYIYLYGPGLFVAEDLQGVTILIFLVALKLSFSLIVSLKKMGAPVSTIQAKPQISWKTKFAILNIPDTIDQEPSSFKFFFLCYSVYVTQLRKS